MRLVHEKWIEVKYIGIEHIGCNCHLLLNTPPPSLPPHTHTHFLSGGGWGSVAYRCEPDMCFLWTKSIVSGHIHVLSHSSAPEVLTFLLLKHTHGRLQCSRRSQRSGGGVCHPPAGLTAPVSRTTLTSRWAGGDFFPAGSSISHRVVMCWHHA